jgi:hypothetical protein
MPGMSVTDKQKLAERLTLQILQQIKPQDGLGDHWGTAAAEAYIACYKKLGQHDFS